MRARATQRRRAARRRCAILLGAALTAATHTAAQDPLVPSPPKGRGEACVEPTPVMRRDHMEFILHQRDETVHRGIRTSRHSFTGCIDCHAVTNPEGRLARFDEPEHFCAGCHTYAAVRIDCFDCHADRPMRTGAESGAGQPAGAQTPTLARAIDDTTDSGARASAP